MNVCAFARSVGMEVDRSQLAFPTYTTAPVPEYSHRLLCPEASASAAHLGEQMGLLTTTVNELYVKRAPLQQTFLAALNL